MRAYEHLDLVAGNTLTFDLADRLLSERAANPRKGGDRLGAYRLLDCLLAGCADVGEPHAVGGKERRERMDQHGRHAECVGDETRMLATGAAKAIERIARDV